MPTLTLPGPEPNTSVEIDYPDEILKENDFKFNTLADIVNEIMKYIFPFAGLILFFMLIAGGFRLLTAAGNEEKIKKGQQQLTNAVIGFIIVFIAFWLIKLIEFVFGVSIFGNE